MAWQQSTWLWNVSGEADISAVAIVQQHCSRSQQTTEKCQALAPHEMEYMTTDKNTKDVCDWSHRDACFSRNTSTAKPLFSWHVLLSHNMLFFAEHLSLMSLTWTRQLVHTALLSEGQHTHHRGIKKWTEQTKCAAPFVFLCCCKCCLNYGLMAIENICPVRFLSH